MVVMELERVQPVGHGFYLIKQDGINVDVGILEELSSIKLEGGH